MNQKMLAQYQDIVAATGTRVSRTVGIEMEGEYDGDWSYGMIENEMPAGAVCKSDGSLSDEYGMEVNSPIMEDLSVLNSIVSVMHDHGWDYTSAAGTHIHVDTSDFKDEDIMRLLWFGEQIQDVLWSLVKDYRYGNTWCYPVHGFSDVPTTDFSRLSYPPRQNVMWWNRQDSHWWNHYYAYSNAHRNVSIGWLVPKEYYKTVEMRLFGWIEDADEAIAYCQLAHNLVALVKDSTFEHLQFIVDHIFSAENAEQAAERFTESLGLPPFPMRGSKATGVVNKKLKELAQTRQTA